MFTNSFVSQGIFLSGLNCVAYDENFQRRLLSKHREWLQGEGKAYAKNFPDIKAEVKAEIKAEIKAEVKIEGVKKRESEPPTLSSPGRSPRKTPAKKEAEPDDHGMDIDDIEAIRDNSGGRGRRYTHKGTRSRPSIHSTEYAV